MYMQSRPTSLETHPYSVTLLPEAAFSRAFAVAAAARPAAIAPTTGVLRVRELTLTASLPAWVATTPALAGSGLAGAASVAEWRRRWQALGYRVLDERPGPQLDPRALEPALDVACGHEGVALGCCGALAQPELVRRIAAEVAGVVRWTQWDLAPDDAAIQTAQGESA